jgi:hypothetical protein
MGAKKPNFLSPPYHSEANFDQPLRQFGPNFAYAAARRKRPERPISGGKLASRAFLRDHQTFVE